MTHGEGKKWYLRAENYATDMMADLKVKDAAVKFGSNFNNLMNKSLKAADFVNKMPWFLKEFAFEIHEMWQKHMHYGQVLPIEDVDRIMKMMSSIVRLPCLCRRFTTGVEGRYCMGITLDPLKADYAESMDKTFYGGPDLHGLEYLKYEEVMPLIRDFEKEGLVHTVWTLKTPFVVGICNCDLPTCTAFQFKARNLRVMFRAEYVAILDSQKCVGCRACLEKCRFDALSYNKLNKKVVLDPVKCYGCGICRAVCPKDAIELIDRRHHVDAKDLWY
jgi:Fe-S-cluster-containing hydrogenase component 2